MDLSKLNVTALANAGITFQLLHPATGEKITNDKGDPTLITVLGADSNLFRSEIKARYRQAILNKKRKNDDDIDDTERKAIELLAKSTVTWQNVCFEGKDLPFTYENAVKIYSTIVWVKEQVDAVIADRSELFKA